MESRRSLSLLRFLAALLMASFCTVAAVALDDPDPNSPTPVLLSYSTSTRALAVSEGASRRVDLSAIPERPFPPNSRVVLFVANLSLMPGEGANAFRVYAQDSQGHFYRFPVVSIEPYSSRHGARGMYAITVQLTDAIGYWAPPDANGDVLVQVTWRGLGSNRVRLGLGRTGGGPADDAGAMPTPPDPAAAKKIAGGGEPDYVGYRWSGDRMRFLEQASFGPNPALDSRVRRIGLRTWLAEQFSAPYPTNPYPNFPLRSDNREDTITGCGMFSGAEFQLCIRDHYSMYQPQTWFFREAFYGDAQLRHRVAWSLGQIWVTSGFDIQQGRHMVEYHKILSNNAFGNYRTLMQQMTLNPTMGEYLSMRLSTRNNPNENYAREIMQLFTIGLFLLNQDGTLKLDGEGNPIPTYDQNGVNNLTKVFTGWNFCNNAANPLCGNFLAGTQNYIDPMVLNRNNHDLTAKTLLTWPADPNFPPNNTDIPACTGCTGTQIDAYAAASMNQALDNMFNHPNVGPFVSRILIQHLVTSDPTPAYVGRVAAVFNNNGSGVRGDLTAVVKAILLDPEARGDAKTDPFYGKLREPVQWATNILRTFNVRSADGASLSDGFITGRAQFNGMAQVPFLAPTVFNYFPPDYIVPGTTMNGPEFAILTTGTSIQRANFGNLVAFTTPIVPGATVNSPNGTSVDYSDLQALAAADTTGNLLVDELNRRMLHSTMSAQMKSTILTAVTAYSAADTLNRARQAVYLIATSSQYQVQR
jgi:uncharacterized protein (DUF1800 family)